MSAYSGTILIVDDNAANLRVLSDCLDQLGFDIRIARDGYSTLERVALEQPDLILLDVMMPGIDGFETCKRLKASKVTQDIPVIFMTALADTADKIKGLTIGAVDYVTKPLQQEEVIARVQLQLQLRRLTQELKSQNAQLQAEVERRKIAEADLQQTLQKLQTAQSQIIAQEKLAALGTLTAGIAHELRNPLNFINNYAEGSIELTQDVLAALKAQSRSLEIEIFQEIQDLLEDILENAEATYRHGHRAEQIINSMMQHARTKGDVDQRQLIDLNILVDEAVQFAYHSLRAKNPNLEVQLETNYDPSISTVEAVSADLSRALINLIENACAATQVKQKQRQPGEQIFTPRVRITTLNQRENIEIRIYDNGLGIPSEIQDKIFDPFFTTKPTGEGTGLGLSISYDIIVNQHRGSLSVNTELGKYTEITITLPQSIPP